MVAAGWGRTYNTVGDGSEGVLNVLGNVDGVRRQVGDLVNGHDDGAGLEDSRGGRGRQDGGEGGEDLETHVGGWVVFLAGETWRVEKLLGRVWR